jgi:hypothetical protein
MGRRLGRSRPQEEHMLAVSAKWLRPALGAVAVVAVLGASMGEASAQYRRYHRGPSGGAVAAGVVGGLALGALAAGAARGSYYDPYYGPAPVYVDPAPPVAPACWYEREDVWNGVGYVPRRVRVCQ